jgi:hypothetical protein
MRCTLSTRILHGFTILVATVGPGFRQNVSNNPVVSRAASSAVSPRLSDLPPARSAEANQQLKIVPPPKPVPPRQSGPGGVPRGDSALQQQGGPPVGVQSKTSFGGIGANGFIPPDPNIAVGKTVSGVGYIVQVVNSQVAVFNKSGTPVSGPVSLDSLWSVLGGGCATNNAGDGIVQYDVQADRWLVSQLGSSGTAPYSECIAISQTRDPSGAYYLYSYDFGSNLSDYPKFGVWPTATNSAYLATYNLFPNAGNTLLGAQLCAYDRAAMLSGATSPTALCFTPNYCPQPNYCPLANDANYLPSDVDGPTSPADGTPGYFLNFETTSSLRLYQLSPDFATGTATLAQVSPDISVAPFTEACSGGVCIAQPNSQQLDSLGDRLMYRLAYRVFSGDHNAMVVNHSVAAGSSVGLRWYELRQPVGGGAFSLFQQGTFAPDSAYRWMGSAAMDSVGNIAIGYSKSSSSIYPSIAFAGRTPSMAPGTLGTETVLVAGKGAQTTYNRWGDYTALRIDPDDDATFWYTNEYYTKNSVFFNFNWSTAIVSFSIGSGGGGSTPDFSLGASPTSITVRRGSNGSTTVTVAAINASSSVNLSVSGLKKGASASFTPDPVSAMSGGSTSTLTISANRNASTGTFGLTISGNNGSVSHSIPLMLTVQ